MFRQERSSITVRWGGGSPPSKLFEFLMLAALALPFVPTPRGDIPTVQCTEIFRRFGHLIREKPGRGPSVLTVHPCICERPGNPRTPRHQDFRMLPFILRRQVANKKDWQGKSGSHQRYMRLSGAAVSRFTFFIAARKSSRSTASASRRIAIIPAS